MKNVNVYFSGNSNQSKLLLSFYLIICQAALKKRHSISPAVLVEITFKSIKMRDK